MTPLKPPPVVRQKSRDGCAVACLRSILAHRGIHVSEKSLEGVAKKQKGGVYIEDLADAFRHFDMQAKIVELDVDGIAQYLSKGIFPIVYLNRTRIDHHLPVHRDFAVHAVIPTRISANFVTFNDPRPGKRRRTSKIRFHAAQRDLNFVCVICEPPP